MRRYDDPVEVRKGPVGAGAEEGPAHFVWRGRLWKVRDVVAHWVETGPWWQAAEARAVVGDDQEPGPGGDLLAEREFWRVEAARDRADAGGVFDLVFDWGRGGWLLTRCLD